MKKISFFSHSATETMQLAKRIASFLNKGDLVGLFGDLGSGKTTFVKGLARGLGLLARINSPGFVILKVYSLNKSLKKVKLHGLTTLPDRQARLTVGQAGVVSFTTGFHRAESRTIPNPNEVSGSRTGAWGNTSLYHFDLYRLKSLKELEDIGYEDFINGSGISVIEWADKAEGLLPEDYLKINIKIKKGNTRVIGIIAYGKRYDRLLSHIKP